MNKTAFLEGVGAALRKPLEFMKSRVGLLQQNRSAPITPSSTLPSVPLSNTLDLLHPTGNTNSFALDGILPLKNRVASGGERTLSGNPPPNTVHINAHGGGPLGYFNLSAETPDGQQALPTTLQQIASKIGPATNNIHNFKSIACNGDRGCTPAEVQKFFPNVTNVVQTPPGRFGLFLPKETPQGTWGINSYYDRSLPHKDVSYLTNSATDLSSPGFQDKYTRDSNHNILSNAMEWHRRFSPYGSLASVLNLFKPEAYDKRTEHLMTGFDAGVSLPHQYLREGTNWVDKGSYHY